MKIRILESIEKRDAAIIAIALIVGLILGSVFFGSSSADKASKQPETETAVHTTYTCSMHPQIKQNKPGDCPICGMDLVPMTSIEAEDNTDPNEIQMTRSAMKLADVQTFTVKREAPEKLVRLQGKVKADERNIAALTARFGGRIEKLYVNYTGQNVKKGQKLASIYSPDLNTAQRELIEAGKYKESNPSFYNASRNKLKLWDLSDAQITKMEQGEGSVYFDILSPISGTVTRRDVAIGDYVKEGSALFEVIDLQQVWLMFDAYESDLPWIKIGDKIEFTLQALPGKIYSGKVSYIDPFINAGTRVAQVRVEMPNVGMKFKPEMFVSGILQSKIAENSHELLIPKSSILWTGKRAVVYVKVPKRETPSFIYREIKLGAEAGNFYVVSGGLGEGEEIASNGVFKIDASAQLLGKASMMNPDVDRMSDEEMMAMAAKRISYAKHVSDKFKTQLAALVSAYLKMKDGFVATNETEVKKEATQVISVLKKMNKQLLKGDARKAWLVLLKPLQANLNGIVKMQGIEMKRSHFSIVSDKITEAIEKFGIKTDEPVYLEFCPMAFDNKGAFWISGQKEIKNPYYGDKMLKCGEVKKEFK